VGRCHYQVASDAVIGTQKLSPPRSVPRRAHSRRRRLWPGRQEVPAHLRLPFPPRPDYQTAKPPPPAAAKPPPPPPEVPRLTPSETTSPATAAAASAPPAAADS
jgi:hypothetical protein